VNYNIFNNDEDLTNYFANLFKERTAKILKNKENIFIALSGGSTPNIYLKKLADHTISHEIEWSRIHFFWVDERMVASTDLESNYHTIKEILFNNILIPEENIHKIDGETVPELEVKRYGTEVINNVSKIRSNLPEFDWILLGMGMDGHTASIFPNVELKYEFQNVAAVSKNPDTGQMRLTLTEAVINNADFVSFIITGKDKAETVREIFKGDKSKFPAGRVSPSNGELEFLLDKEAASLLVEADQT
jgi:6-phosphogluconolactonase